MQSGNGRRMQSCGRGAFTLIELLLVMVILAILATVVMINLHPGQRAEQARIASAHASISNLEVALDAMELDVGRYPTNDEGLGGLVTTPTNVQNWNGPYVKGGIPIDPWKRPYVYKYPGQHNPDSYDLYSLGSSGQDGGNDNIGNWAEAQTP